MPSQPNKPAPSPLPALLALGAIMGILALTILSTPARGDQHQRTEPEAPFLHAVPIGAALKPTAESEATRHNFGSGKLPQSFLLGRI